MSDRSLVIRQEALCPPGGATVVCSACPFGFERCMEGSDRYERQVCYCSSCGNQCFNLRVLPRFELSV